MDKSTTRRCDIVTPKHGPEITVTGGFLHGDPAVALFVGEEAQPIVLTRYEAKALADLLWKHTGGGNWRRT